MAHRLMLPGKPGGMPWIWNVDAHVGDSSSCANQPTDVELVKLFVIAMDSSNHGSGAHPNSLAPALVLSGRFDQTLAYKIFRRQGVYRARTPDGIISPVGRSGDPSIWTLADWNSKLRRGFPTVWENLHKWPGISIALQTAMMRSV